MALGEHRTETADLGGPVVAELGTLLGVVVVGKNGGDGHQKEDYSHDLKEEINGERTEGAGE